MAPDVLKTKPAPGDDRPVAFLVSTTPAARDIAAGLGTPAYSYHFVVEALAPVLASFGTWRLVDHPERRLAFAAARAEAEGFRPVHLVVNPLQDVYLSPALPNVVFPFWEFPDLPDRDFAGFDTRQNWVRACRPVALVLTACRFTAEAFRRSGVACPVAVVPVPVDPDAFALPDFDPARVTTLRCRHEVLGPAPDPAPAGAAATPAPADSKAWRLARAGFRRVAPRLDPRVVGRLTRWGRGLAGAGGAKGLDAPASRGDRLFLAARGVYRDRVRPWLSDEAVARVTRWKRTALARLGRPASGVPDPLLPTGDLALGGLVFLTVFNVGDPRKNYADILTAFLSAFGGRADATLVVKLVTNRACEHHEAGVLREKYRSLGMPHECRVAVVTEYLDEPAMAALFAASAFYVNASHAEGACLPLMRALAGGRPAVAPAHSAMADYMGPEIGYVVGSHPEPAAWPHDPEKRLETSRARLVWADLRDGLLAAARDLEHDPARYASKASAARRAIRAHAGRGAARAALGAALGGLGDAPSGALDWPRVVA